MVGTTAREQGRKITVGLPINAVNLVHEMRDVRGIGQSHGPSQCRHFILAVSLVELDHLTHQLLRGQAGDGFLFGRGRLDHFFLRQLEIGHFLVQPAENPTGAEAAERRAARLREIEDRKAAKTFEAILNGAPGRATKWQVTA